MSGSRNKKASNRNIELIGAGIMKPSIRLMAEFGASPVWDTTPGCEGNIPTDSLPISGELKKDLDAWADQYTQIVNEDPSDPSFRSGEEEAQFIRMGDQLQARLKAELAGKIDVDE